MSAEVVLEAVDLRRDFTGPAGTVTAVAGVSLTVRAGELVAVRGPSGSGKTTLLNMLGGLDEPTSGTVRLEGTDLGGLGQGELLRLRRERISYVFQSFGLLAELTATENVEVPLRLAAVPPAERTERVAAALAAVGLTGHVRQRPGELSGGQQQRVGIARAVVGRPRVLLADEPTGQLDSVTAVEIMGLLQDLVHGQGLAAVVATHDPLLMERADRVLEIRDGRLAAETGGAAPVEPVTGPADGRRRGRHTAG